MAPAARLFIAGVDVSAAGADATVKDGAAFFLNVSIIKLDVPVVAASLVAVFTIVIVRQWWVRSQIQTTAATRPLAHSVVLPASTAGPVRAAASAMAARMSTAPQNHRGRGKHTPTAGWSALTASVPVPIRGTGCVGTTPTHPSVTVALVDTP